MKYMPDRWESKKNKWREHERKDFRPGVQKVSLF